MDLTEAQKDAIWDVLVETCGASERWRDDFTAHFPKCREFRFQGALGLGGKVWADHGVWTFGQRVYVDCYAEDETPARLDMIERANAALASLLA